MADGIELIADHAPRAAAPTAPNARLRGFRLRASMVPLSSDPPVWSEPVAPAPELGTRLWICRTRAATDSRYRPACSTVWYRFVPIRPARTSKAGELASFRSALSMVAAASTNRDSIWAADFSTAASKCDRSGSTRDDKA